MPERCCWTRSFPIILRAAAEILTLLQVPLATEKQNALLRCETRTATKRSVTVLRDLTPDAFREELRHANDLSRRYVVNFARGRIFGAGVGHHWPLGGYLEAEDLVLVLDVNEKFKPWLIERSRLYNAMNTLDGDKKQGLLRIE